MEDAPTPTAVRVVARLRPLASSRASETRCVTVAVAVGAEGAAAKATTEKEADAATVVRWLNVDDATPTTTTTASDDAAVAGDSPTRDFTFDAALPESATQEQVFLATCGSMVDRVLAGFNATVLAYGQTGSGKSHTMMGPSIDDAVGMGVIPRLAVELFRALEKHGSSSGSPTLTIEATCRVTFVEIYRERLQDLLDASANKPPPRVRELDGGRVVVEGLEELFVSSAADVLSALRKGNAMRSVGATRMNADSSRSHSVFTLTLEQTNRADGTQTVSKLVLVDLAGSESVKRTGAAGDRLEEAKSINQSLSALGNCVNALVEKRAHVPFRDSKLTRLLQDSLGGRAVTCLIVTLSPAPENAVETLSTLRFGQRAKKVQNRVVKNVRRTVEELEKLLAEAEERLRRMADGAAMVSTSTSTSLTMSVTPRDERREAELVERAKDLETELRASRNAVVAARDEAKSWEERWRRAEDLRAVGEAAASEVALRERRALVEMRALQAQVEALRAENAVLARELVSSSASSAGPGSGKAPAAPTPVPPSGGFRTLRRTSSFPPARALGGGSGVVGASASSGAAGAGAPGGGAPDSASGNAQAAGEAMELDVSVPQRKALRDSDVRALTAKCVELQVALMEAREELEAMRDSVAEAAAAPSSSSSSSSSQGIVATLRARIEEQAAQAALAARKHQEVTMHMQEHIDMLEAALLEFQRDFRAKVETFTERERALEEQAATLRAALWSRPDEKQAHVVVKPIVVGLSLIHI